MTSHLVILGDSLVDAGNTSAITSLVGANPWADPIYDKGGNTKASDGLVLGEFTAIEMGATIDNSQLISVISTEQLDDVQVHNYAHGGARTSMESIFTVPGSEQVVAFGLQAQINSIDSRSAFYQNRQDVDVVLSCGGNDIRDIYYQVEIIEEIVSTKTKSDDKEFIRLMAKPIARNLNKAIRKIDAFVDEIAVLGALPLMETPEGKDWLTNFENKDQVDVASIIHKIGYKMMKKLNNKTEGFSDIVVVDGNNIWNQVTNKGFVDDVHPNAETSSKLAALFVNDASENLSTFGF